MKTAIVVFFLALVTCVLCQADTWESHLNDKQVNETALRMRADIEKGGLPRLANFIDQDLDVVVDRAVSKFRAVNQDNELTAEEFEWQYRQNRGLAVRELLSNGRHQGDHQAAIQFLVDLYHKSVQLIGLEATEMLHISDLATISWAIPVTFHPVTFSPNLILPSEPRETDYVDHFAKDIGNDHLYGLASVATFWAIEIGCSAGTAGIATLICGPAASAGEFIMGTRLGPPLGRWIYERANDL